VRVWHRYLQMLVSCEARESRSRRFPVRNAFFFGRVVASAKRKPILPGVIFLPLRALTLSLSVIPVAWLWIGFQANPFILLLLRHRQLGGATTALRCYLSYSFCPKEKRALLIIHDYCSILMLAALGHNWLFKSSSFSFDHCFFLLWYNYTI
jgi:hypothetical protein